MTKEGFISRPRRISLIPNALGNRFLPALTILTGLTPFGASAIVSGAARVPASATAEGGQVTSVRFWSLGEITRVAIEVSSPFTYSANRLSGPDRLFFDIRGARPAMVHKGIHSMPVNNALVNQIRIAETQPKVTRVVLDLAQPATITTSQLANPYRLIVELRARGASALPPGGESTLSKILAPGLNENIPGNPRFSDSNNSNSNNKENNKDNKVEAKARDEAPPAKDALPSVAALEEKEAALRAEAAAIHRDAEPAPTHKRREGRKFEPPPPTPRAPLVYAEPDLPAPPRLALAAKPVHLPSFSSTPLRDLPPPAPVEIASLTPVPATADPSPSLGEPAAAKTFGDSSLTRVLGLKLGRIVLDPGHGGQDVGTHGPSGYTEKDLVLDVAHRLGALLEERLGSEVVYTRAGDTYVPLEERTHIANQRKADLFLSIHANSSPYRSAAGVETYVLNFTPSKAANDLAARENASSSSSIHDLRNLVEKIASADKANESREFASRLQYSLSALSTRSNDEARNRGVKRAPFVVLIGAAMPSVLAEIGFLTNSEEEALLRKPEHRQKIAEALYKGIANYAETLSRFDVTSKDVPHRDVARKDVARLP